MAWLRKSFALLLIITVSKVSAQHEALLRGLQSGTTFSKNTPDTLEQALGGECEDGDPCLVLQVEREERMAADEALEALLQQEVMGLSEADSSVQDSIVALKEEIDRKLQMLASAAGTYQIVGENVTITIDLDKRCSRDKVDIGKGEEVSFDETYTFEWTRKGTVKPEYRKRKSMQVETPKAQKEAICARLREKCEDKVREDIEPRCNKACEAKKKLNDKTKPCKSVGLLVRFDHDEHISTISCDSEWVNYSKGTITRKMTLKCQLNRDMICGCDP